MIQFDQHFFQMAWFSHQLVVYFIGCLSFLFEMLSECLATILAIGCRRNPHFQPARNFRAPRGAEENEEETEESSGFIWLHLDGNLMVNCHEQKNT